MELDPFSHEFHDDPYPVYRWLRDNAPCYRNEKVGFYALSRYEDVVDASQQPLLFSSADGTTIEMLDTTALLPMMIFMDPPDHDVQRKLVSRALLLGDAAYPLAQQLVDPVANVGLATKVSALRRPGGLHLVRAQ